MNKFKQIGFLRSTLVVFMFYFGVSIAHAKDWVYKVRSGDNLWDITSDYLIDSTYVKRVQQLNEITDPWHLRPGTKIRIPDKWIRHFPTLLQVQNLQGTAHILEEGSDQVKTLKNGAIVLQGDTVMTGSGSTLVLVFLDGSSVLLQENSRLTIDHLTVLENTGMSDSRLQLEVGRMETQVAPSKGELRLFQIKTPATVTAVRGTDYRVSSELEKKESRTEVVEGNVDVKGVGKSRSLSAGFGTITVKGQEPSPPVKLLPEPDVSRLPETFDQVPIQFAMPILKEGQGYRLQISKTTLFKDILFNKLIYSSTIRGPDFPDGEYHMRVRGVDVQQLEGLNAQRKFIINARPEAPFLVSPNAGQGYLIDESAVFSWSKLKKAKRYHFQISKDKAFSDLLIDKQDIDSSELEVDEEMAVGKYYWRVATVDEEGDGPFSDGQMFRRITPAPDLEAPDITEDSLTIRSRSGLPGQTYHFQIAEDESFSELLVDEQTQEPKVEIPRPDGGTYYVRIGTIDSDGFVGPFSKPQSISVPYNLYWLLTLLPLLALIAL